MKAKGRSRLPQVGRAAEVRDTFPQSPCLWDEEIPVCKLAAQGDAQAQMAGPPAPCDLEPGPLPGGVCTE